MKVSVCMATFNGEEFVEQQLGSILNQLRDDDEVVIVDDCSQDRTVDILKAIEDRRVRLLENGVNLGVLGTFERAILESTGDLVFLSDQDDVWRRDKVALMLEAFVKYPDVTLIASDASLIDKEGRTISDSFFSKRGAFSSGVVHNVIKNKFLGCTLAFRRTMISYIMPIPRSVPMHDIWIGVLNEIHGRTAFIDQPLVYYRRHGGNVSSMTGAPLLRRVSWRLELVKCLVTRVLRNWSSGAK